MKRETTVGKSYPPFSGSDLLDSFQCDRSPENKTTLPNSTCVVSAESLPVTAEVVSASLSKQGKETKTAKAHALERMMNVVADDREKCDCSRG